MDISIIVPVYNEENLIARCIESFSEQIETDLAYELILVDDGSTDASFQICKKYSDMYTWIKTYHKENGGCIDSRRFGLERASGKYIAFADADDYVERDYIKNIERAISHEADYYIFNNKKTFFLHDGRYVEKDFLHEGRGTVEEAAEWVLLSRAGAVWDKLFSYEFIKRNNIYFEKNISHGDDKYINMLILMNRPSIYIQDTSSYVHIENSPTSIFAHSASPDRLDEIYAIYEVGSDLINRLNLQCLRDQFELYIIGEFVKNIGLMDCDHSTYVKINDFFMKRKELYFLKQKKASTLKEKIFIAILKSKSYKVAHLLAKLIHSRWYYKYLDHGHLPKICL